jgi:polygalacturonase
MGMGKCGTSMRRIWVISMDGMFLMWLRADRRPMGLTILDAYNVVVKDFAVIQPSFWAHLAAQSENVYYHNMYVNATNENPEIVSDFLLISKHHRVRVGSAEWIVGKFGHQIASSSSSSLR